MGNAKYDRANTRTISIKLNRRTDEDILKKLDSLKGYAGYIKALIRQDIEREASK